MRMMELHYLPPQGSIDSMSSIELQAATCRKDFLTCSRSVVWPVCFAGWIRVGQNVGLLVELLFVHLLAAGASARTAAPIELIVVIVLVQILVFFVILVLSYSSSRFSSPVPFGCFHFGRFSLC